MQAEVSLLVTDVMPIYMIIAMNNVITMHFSINCPTVIYLPTVCYFSREKPLEKTMALGYTLIILLKPKIPCCNLLFYFVLQFIYHLLPDLILAINEYKGIDNPLARIGASICSCV